MEEEERKSRERTKMKKKENGIRRKMQEVEKRK
jgi:hypothetical protein